MIKSGSAPSLPAIGKKIQSLLRFKFFFGLLAAVLITVAATPPPNQQLPDEQYVHIMDIIDRADALRVAGKTDAAKAKYHEAQKALIYFKAANPLFDPTTVAYRLKEVTERADTRPLIVDSTNSATAPKAGLEAEAPPAPKSPVKVLDAGLEPRKVLRFHVSPGDKQSVILTVKASVGTAPMAGAASGTSITNPAVTIPMDVSIQNVATNGDVTFEAVTGDADVIQDTNTPPEKVQSLKKSLAGLKGVTVTGVITSVGISKKIEFKGTASTDPEVRGMSELIRETMSAPGLVVPEEAVGAGAKWEVALPSKLHGMTMNQKATYQLVSVDGDHANATYEAEISPASQKASAQAQMKIKMTGSVTVDFSKLVAPVSTLAADSEGGPMNMNMNISLEAK